MSSIHSTASNGEPVRVPLSRGGLICARLHVVVAYVGWSFAITAIVVIVAAIGIAVLLDRR